MPAVEKVDPLAEGICDRISVIQRRLMLRHKRSLDHHGISWRDWQVLTNLMLGGETPRSPGDLASTLMVTTGAMTNVLDRLEEAGLTRRVRNPADRRGVIVEATDDGVALWYAAVNKSGAGGRGRIGADCAEQRRLNSLLRKLLAGFGDGDNGTRTPLRGPLGAVSPASRRSRSRRPSAHPRRMSFHIHFARGAKSSRKSRGREWAHVANVRVGNRKERDNFRAVSHPNVRNRRFTLYGGRSRELARGRVPHLAALESISTEGSFSAAAAKTGYSQSAISGQIATLERVIGVRLVTRIRGARKVTLTREGERLVEHARAINARLSAARADIEQLDETGANGVRIGTFQSVSQTLLPDIVRGLTADGTPLTLREGMEVEHQVEMLRSGELDVAFVLLPIDDESVETMELLRDPWVLVNGRTTRSSGSSGLRRPTTSRTCRSSRSSSFGRRS